VRKLTRSGFRLGERWVNIRVMTHLAGHDRSQTLLLPEPLDDYVGPENPVRFIEAFVDGLDLTAAGFIRVTAKRTGRPGFAPADLLKLYIYGYLNRVRSSHRLEAETHRNIEVIWLLRHLKPDYKTIADCNASSPPMTRSTTSFISVATTFPPASIELQGGVRLRRGPTSAGLLPRLGLDLRANVALGRFGDGNLTVPLPWAGFFLEFLLCAERKERAEISCRSVPYWVYHIEFINHGSMDT
jgi:hypothetical protein